MIEIVCLVNSIGKMLDTRVSVSKDQKIVFFGRFFGKKSVFGWVENDFGKEKSEFKKSGKIVDFSPIFRKIPIFVDISAIFRRFFLNYPDP